MGQRQFPGLALALEKERLHLLQVVPGGIRQVEQRVRVSEKLCRVRSVARVADHLPEIHRCMRGLQHLLVIFG
jgi:hypothetical protein